jgi:hypothetical protein
MMVAAGALLAASTAVHAQERTEKSEKAAELLRAPKLGSPMLPDNIFGPAPSSNASTRAWFSVDYLLWFTSTNSTPPLVVTAPNGSPNFTTTAKAFVPTSPGFGGLLTISAGNRLGVDNASSVQYGNGIANWPGSGGRFTFGEWLDSAGTIGFEARYLALFAAKTVQPRSNQGLAIPYLDQTSLAETSYPVNQRTFANTQVFINTTPDVFVGLYNTHDQDSNSGTLTIHTWTFLQSGEANAIFNLSRGRNWSVEGVVGLRFIDLQEKMSISSDVRQAHESATTFEPALGLPTAFIPVVIGFVGSVDRTDNYETRNNFYGGQFGARGTYSWGRWSLEGGGQVGLGTMHQSVDISGLTVKSGFTSTTPTNSVFLAGIPLSVPSGAPQLTSPNINTAYGGLFSASNAGHYSRNMFAVVPEANFKVRCQLNERWSASLGYSFLYMSSVARPGDQINRVVNPQALAVPGTGTVAPNSPFQIHGGDFWAQGLDFGLMFKF